METATGRFRDDRSGIAAVEFALILPLMLLIYLGGLDAMRMVRAADKAENASKTTADLTAQEQTGSPNPASDVATILGAATVAAAPFNGPALQITVSAVDLKVVNNVCCTATVNWSVTQGGTLRPCSTTLRPISPPTAWAIDTIPAAIATQTTPPANGIATYSTAVIVTDVFYAYAGVSPAISTFTTATIARHSYSIPRTLGQVTISSTSGLASGQSGVVCPSS